MPDYSPEEWVAKHGSQVPIGEQQFARDSYNGSKRLFDRSPKDSPEEDFTIPAEFSDDALALAFSERHDGMLLYVPAWSQWLCWDGSRWASDDTLAVYDLVRASNRGLAMQANATNRDREKLARAINSAGTVSAVERLARSDRRHARSPDMFDADPWALNTPAGVVDLQTGRIRPHCKDDLFTKVTGVSPDGECQRWLAFLDEITQRDADLVAFLHRFIGYTLTGVITEHAFVFLVGPGGNGKSVLLGTVAAALGDYATTAMQDTFTVGRNDQHPTHLASLRGARLVAVTETEADRPWAESRIKSLTGGDKISARVMRGNPFEFSPEFKLWVAGNHKPTLRNPDPAMRRRLHLVPLTFVPATPDTKLADALRAELAGILAWAIAGCLEWQRIGLKPPAIVTDATDAYFADQNSVEAWFAERCERKNYAETSSRTMFADFSTWMKARGEEPGTEKRFSEAMERYAAKKRSKHGIVFLGIRLLSSDTGVWT